MRTEPTAVAQRDASRQTAIEVSHPIQTGSESCRQIFLFRDVGNETLSRAFADRTGTPNWVFTQERFGRSSN